MKLLTTIISVLILNFALLAEGFNPEVLISNEDVEVIAIAGLDFFQSSTYNSDTENLSFYTTKTISVVQIFNMSEEMEFQLPVMSNNVEINKNLFGSGRYKLGFLLEGQTNVHFAHVTIR